MEGLREIFRNELIKRGKNILLALDKHDRKALIREIHTLKGTSRMMGYSMLGKTFQRIERRIKEKESLDDELLNLLRRIGEVVSQGDIENLSEELEVIIEKKEGKKRKFLPDLLNVRVSEIMKIETFLSMIIENDDLERIKKLAKEGISIISSILLYPLKPIMEQVIKEANELAKKLGKEVDLEIEGADIFVDRRISEELLGPLSHIVNNAIDHGIEPPEERIKKGKRERGTIMINVKKSGRMVEITIEDDGRGLQIEKITDKGKRIGVNLTPEELVFIDGFTTREKPGDISGMGAGLSSVRSSIRRIGGEITVSTKTGEFTRFKISIPFVLSTNRVFVFSDGKNYYGIPSNLIKNVKKEPEKGVIKLNTCEEGILVKAKDGVSIWFKALIDLRKVVIKDMPEYMKHPAYTGFFIYKGNPCLVINPKDFVKVALKED